MTNNFIEDTYPNWDYFVKKFNLDCNESIFVDLKKALDEAYIEGKSRREKEILIMMDECEKEGWDFNRFINTFSALINKNEKNIA